MDGSDLLIPLLPLRLIPSTEVERDEMERMSFSDSFLVTRLYSVQCFRDLFASVLDMTREVVACFYPYYSEIWKYWRLFRNLEVLMLQGVLCCDPHIQENLRQ